MKYKPKWEDAPHWANYLAMDYDGQWYWYEKKPEEDGGLWVTEDGFRWQVAIRDDEIEWSETLEKRP